MKLENLRIGLVVPVPPPYGGIANWSENLIASLKKRNIKYFIVNTAPKKRTTEGRTLFDRVVRSGIAMFNEKKELRDLILKKKINVIHMTTSGELAIIRDYCSKWSSMHIVKVSFETSKYCDSY